MKKTVARSVETLHRQLLQASGGEYVSRRINFGLGRTMLAGIERREDPSEYKWDGMKRGGDPARPFLVIQYTLVGFGVFEERDVPRQVEPGHAFLAVVPSLHRYYLPVNSPRWTFFYLLLTHPYIVRRMIDRLKIVDRLLQFDPDCEVVQAMTRLFKGNFQDSFDLEQSLFDLLIAFERSCDHRLYSHESRDQLLEDVRQRVLQHIGRPIDIATIAADWGMTRSHFSHYFKSTTGLSPARFIIDIRVDQATRRLAETDDKLEIIARSTGFADANHMCKVFRRCLHISPGEYRRQVQ